MALSQGLGDFRAQPVEPETGAGERLPSSVSQQLEARNVLRLVRDDLNAALDEGRPEDSDDQGWLRGTFGANLAIPYDPDHPERGVRNPVPEATRKRIAGELMRGIKSDLSSRKQWEEMAKRAIQFLGLIYEEASAEVSEGSVSKAWATLMLEAALGFWANAYAEFLPADGPVKVRDDMPASAGMGHNPAPPLSPGAGSGNEQGGGPPIDDGADPNIDRATLADAFELTYNHYLLVGDKQYYRDFSRMLWSLGPIGTEFRKIYYNPLRKMPVSEWVKSDNLIISNEAADISTAQRITERMPTFLQADVKRLQYSGWWLDVPLTQPQLNIPEVQKKGREVEGISAMMDLPADHPHTVWECYVQRDLEGFEHEDEDGRTGLPLPYRFVMVGDENSGEIVEIRRNWKEDDEDFAQRQRYVMFGLVPGFGLYYLGFSHLLGNTERAATALTREMIDANMMSIFPAWLAELGALPKGTTQIRVGPMGVQEVNTQLKKSVSDALQPIPIKPLDPQTLAVLNKLEQNGRNVSGKLELPQGEGTQNIPVGTMIAIVEQSTKVMMAVHKGLHASRAEELELLRELIAEDPSVLSKNAKISAARRAWTAEEFADLDLVPSSDPNTPSHVHRLMRGIGLAQLSQMFPQLANGPAIFEALLRILQVQSPQNYILPPEAQQAQPNPQAIQAQVKQGIAQLNAQMKQMEIASRERTSKAHDQSDLQTAMIEAQTEKIKQQGQLAGDAMKRHAEQQEGVADREHEIGMQARDHAADAQDAERQRQHDARLAAQQAAAQRFTGSKL